MEFASLGSGSSGNSTLVRAGDTVLMIDCGFSLKKVLPRLQRLNIEADNLTAILVTHEHGDHINGVGALARKYSIPVYMTAGTSRAKNIGRLPHLELIKEYTAFSLGDFDVIPVAVPHDAAEPAQFIVSTQSHRLGLLTDLGSITPDIERRYCACDALILEANHDPLMLASGPYPVSVKRRVSGPWGHLSNEQASALLSNLDCSNLQYLVLAHISQKNNALDRVKDVFFEVTHAIKNVIYASQDEGFGWLTLVSVPRPPCSLDIYPSTFKLQGCCLRQFTPIT